MPPRPTYSSGRRGPAVNLCQPEGWPGRLRDHFVELSTSWLIHRQGDHPVGRRHQPLCPPANGISLRYNGELLGRPIVEKLPAETAHPILKTAKGLIAESQASGER